jgi:hypothetical protein
MCKFVCREDVVSWLPPGAKVEVSAVRERLCVQRLVHLRGVVAGVYTHVSEVSAEAGFHERFHARRERPAGSLRCVEPSYEEIAAIDALRVACEATSNVVLTFR